MMTTSHAHHITCILSHVNTVVVKAQIVPGIAQTHYQHNIHNQHDVKLVFQQTIRYRKTRLVWRMQLQLENNSY